jgi:hypothetical protein
MPYDAIPTRWVMLRAARLLKFAPHSPHVQDVHILVAVQQKMH